MGNYHWYLKQSLDFGRDSQKAPVCVCWDPERPLRLHVVTRSWISITYDWGWTTGRSPGLDATDKWPGETAREWGRKIAMDPEVVKKVDAMLDELGLGKP